MTHPLLILVPWAVFAVALALKVLKFGSALKRHLNAQTPSPDQFRQTLERIWEKEQKRATGALSTGRKGLKAAVGKDWMRDPYLEE